jgi:outer membrane protein assembly factor BamB
MKANLTGVVTGVLLCAGALRADDWPAFRGPSGNGIAAEAKAPTAWAPDKNVKWKTALPLPGNGSPIVSNGRVFLAGSEDKEGKVRALYCFDRKDGRQLWAKTINFGKVMRTHGTNTYSPSTPASDGKSVVVWHGSAGLHCYDFEGKSLWSRDLGEFDHLWGEGTSPVIHDGTVFLNSGPGKKKVFVAAFKLASGETIWEKEEPFKGDGDTNEDGKYMGSWSTPLLIKAGGQEQLICSLPTRVAAYAPQDGKPLWSCDGLRFANGDLAYSSPVLVGDTCVVFGGFMGVGLGVKLGGSGDVTGTHRLWRLDKKVPQSIGSGVAVGDYVYLPFDQTNVIDCIDPKTGKQVWRERQKAGFWGSMVLAGDKAYVTDQKGRTVVFKPNPEKFELVAVNELGEPSNSTPAISNGEIFIRTFKHLYCISE